MIKNNRAYNAACLHNIFFVYNRVLMYVIIIYILFSQFTTYSISKSKDISTRSQHGPLSYTKKGKHTYVKIITKLLALQLS